MGVDKINSQDIFDLEALLYIRSAFAAWHISTCIENTAQFCRTIPKNNLAYFSTNMSLFQTVPLSLNLIHDPNTTMCPMGPKPFN